MILGDEWLLAADLQLLDRPGIAVGVAEADEGATVALVEHRDLAALDTPIDELLACRVVSATTSWRPCIEPGVIWFCDGRSPKTIEQPEPRGVSWTTCIYSVRVSWSRSKPTLSR